MRFEYKKIFFDIEGVSKNDHIYKQIANRSTFYEIDLLEYIYNIKTFIISKDCENVFVDIGANIGNHSVFFCSFLADHTLAIEPNPDVISKLKENLSKNASNYTIFECGVGDKESTGTIILSNSTTDNIGAAKIDTHNCEGGINISTVDVLFSTWKAKVDKLVSISLLKIDVEGMEPQVLKGSLNTIQNFRPHIFAEAATQKEFQETFKILKPLGYRVMPGNWAATPVYHFAPNPTASLIATSFFWQARRVIIKVLSSITRCFTRR